MTSASLTPSVSFENDENLVRAGDSAPREQASLFAVLLRRAPIIIVVTLLSAGAAAAFAYASRDDYESTAKLLFRQTVGLEQNAQGLQPGAPDADNLAQNNVAVVDSRRVADETAEQLGGDVSGDDVANDVTVIGQKDSDVVNVVAKADSAGGAAELATTYAETARRQAQADQQAETVAALGSVSRQLRELPPKARAGDQAATLRENRDKLRTLADVGPGSPQIIQLGFVPEGKSGSPLETILLGALFGLILGVGLALLRDQMDRRLHHAAEVSAAFDAPVLTTVPRNRKLKRAVPFHELPLNVAESFRMLHMNLRFGMDPPVRSVLVTSARSREGKTTVAWNLACAAASSGLSVTLVEADLRRPSMAERYGLRPGPGLSELLRGEVLVADALQSVPTREVDSSTNGAPDPMQVLVAGAPPPDPWALMQSPAMVRTLELVARDLVVIDTPPIPHVADAIALLRRVDGVLVCASVNSTSGPEAGRLRHQLETLDARVLGVVANGGSAATGYAYAPPRGGGTGTGGLTAGTRLEGTPNVPSARPR
jgi:succinoglycan biosynthesis transport protein ExoP